MAPLTLTDGFPYAGILEALSKWEIQDPAQNALCFDEKGALQVLPREQAESRSNYLYSSQDVYINEKKVIFTALDKLTERLVSIDKMLIDYPCKTREDYYALCGSLERYLDKYVRLFRKLKGLKGTVFCPKDECGAQVIEALKRYETQIYTLDESTTTKRAALNLHLLMDQWDMEAPENTQFSLDDRELLLFRETSGQFEPGDVNWDRQNASVLQEVYSVVETIVTSLQMKLSKPTDANFSKKVKSCAALDGLGKLLALFRAKMDVIKIIMHEKLPGVSTVLEEIISDVDRLIAENFKAKSTLLASCQPGVLAYIFGAFPNGTLVPVSHDKPEKVGQACIEGRMKPIYASLVTRSKGQDSIMRGDICFTLKPHTTLGGRAEPSMYVSRVWSGERPDQWLMDYQKLFNTVVLGGGCSSREAPSLMLRIFPGEGGYTQEIDTVFRRIAYEIWKKFHFFELIHKAVNNWSANEYAKGFKSRDQKHPTLAEQERKHHELKSSGVPPISVIFESAALQEIRCFYLEEPQQYEDLPSILDSNFKWPEFFGLPNQPSYSFRDIMNRQINGGRMPVNSVAYNKTFLPFHQMDSKRALVGYGHVPPMVSEMVQAGTMPTSALTKEGEEALRAKFRGEDKPTSAWIPHFRRYRP